MQNIIAVTIYLNGFPTCINTESKVRSYADKQWQLHHIIFSSGTFNDIQWIYWHIQQKWTHFTYMQAWPKQMRQFSSILKQWMFLKQICTNLQIIILSDNYVMLSAKILKRSLPEVFLYTAYEYIWEALEKVDHTLMCPICFVQACTLPIL